MYALYLHIFRITLYVCNIYIYSGLGSSVVIETDYGLGILGSNSGRDKVFRQKYWPWGPTSLLYNGYCVFPGGEERSGRAADHSPLLVPRSWKSSAVPLHTLWATPCLKWENFKFFLYTECVGIKWALNNHYRFCNIKANIMKIMCIYTSRIWIL